MQADPRRLYQVTANLFFWQGLRFVPFGLSILLTSLLLTNPPWWPLPYDWNDRVMLAASGIALLAFHWIGRYYGRAFGSVRELPGLHRRRGQIKWLVAYPAMVASLMIDAVLSPPLLVSGLVWAGALLAYWWSTGGGRLHYVGAASVLFAVAFVPALDLIAPEKPKFALLFAIVGAIYVVGGFLDHRELVRLLQPVKEERDVRAI